MYGSVSKEVMSSKYIKEHIIMCNVKVCYSSNQY